MAAHGLTLGELYGFEVLGWLLEKNVVTIDSGLICEALNLTEQEVNAGLCWLVDRGHITMNPTPPTKH